MVNIKTTMWTLGLLQVINGQVGWFLKEYTWIYALLVILSGMILMILNSSHNKDYTNKGEE